DWSSGTTILGALYTRDGAWTISMKASTKARCERARRNDTDWRFVVFSFLSARGSTSFCPPQITFTRIIITTSIWISMAQKRGGFFSTAAVIGGGKEVPSYHPLSGFLLLPLLF